MSKCTPHRTEKHVEERQSLVQTQNQTKKCQSGAGDSLWFDKPGMGILSIFTKRFTRVPVGALHLLVALQNRQMPRKVGVQRLTLG